MVAVSEAAPPMAEDILNKKQKTVNATRSEIIPQSLQGKIKVSVRLSRVSFNKGTLTNDNKDLHNFVYH